MLFGVIRQELLQILAICQFQKFQQIEFKRMVFYLFLEMFLAILFILNLHLKPKGMLI